MEVMIADGGDDMIQWRPSNSHVATGRQDRDWRVSARDALVNPEPCDIQSSRSQGL